MQDITDEDAKHLIKVMGGYIWLIKESSFIGESY